MTLSLGFSIGSLIGGLAGMTFGILGIVYNNYPNVFAFLSLGSMAATGLVIGFRKYKSYTQHYHHSISRVLPVGN